VRKAITPAGIAAVLAIVGLASGLASPPPNVDRALAAQRALVAKEPTAEHLNDLGNLLLLAQRPGEAEEAYERALELDEEALDARYNLALLQQARGKERGALRHLQRVVEADPERAQAWFQIGLLHERAGAEGAAVRAYARAYLLRPGLSFADENPQVLDSELTTQALLAAKESLAPGSDAPLAYAEPRRIAGLLLPAPPPEAVASPAPAPADGGVVAATPPGTAQPRLGGEPAPEARILRPQDLDPGSRVGQVAGAPGARGTVTHLPQGQPQQDYSEMLRQRLLQQQGQEYSYDEVAPPEDEVVVEEGEAPPADVPGGFFTPDGRSTGQLDYQLDFEVAALGPRDYDFDRQPPTEPTVAR
jgi:tetratricopeptide (TPR) repeat protein